MPSAEEEVDWGDADESVRAEAEAAVAEATETKEELQEERWVLKRKMADAIHRLAVLASKVCEQAELGTRNKHRTDPALASSQGNETQAATKGDALKLVREKERVTDEEMQEQYEQVKYRFCFNIYVQAVAPVIVLCFLNL